MINADEFKKAMREISKVEYPCGPLCTGCGMYLNVKIGTIDYSGRLDTTCCLKVLANYLDREWKKEEERQKAQS
jgi:hypothetical protein